MLLTSGDGFWPLNIRRGRKYCKFFKYFSDGEFETVLSITDSRINGEGVERRQTMLSHVLEMHKDAFLPLTATTEAAEYR